MSYNSLTRNLRDGSIAIKDGASTPLECVIPCDEGNLSWTEGQEVFNLKCRGTPSGNRVTEVNNCELTYTVDWTQLIQYTEDDSDPIVPYEIINNLGDGVFTSTSNGEYTLDHVFTVVDPGGVSANDEIITFEDVLKVSLTPTEGAERNTLEFTGVCAGAAPTIARGT